jgi:ankyrin repeat protein
MMKNILVVLLSFYSSVLMAQDNDSLYRAVAKNDTTLLRQLIKQGADVNYIKQEGWMKVSPLITAVNGKNIALIKILLENRADVNWKDGFKTTALMYAASDGKEDIVKLLLDSGADVFAKDEQGNDVLSAAKESKNDKVIELIRQARKKSK